MKLEASVLSKAVKSGAALRLVHPLNMRVNACCAAAPSWLPTAEGGVLRLVQFPNMSMHMPWLEFQQDMTVGASTSAEHVWNVAS